MNRIQLLGIIMIIAGITVAYFSERSDYEFLSWIMAAFGVGWAFTGKFTVSKKKNYTETSSES